MDSATAAWSELVQPEYQNGNHEAFSIRLDSMTLKSGDRVAFTSSGVTAFVGGNNVGKSTILSEANQLLKRNYPPGRTEIFRIVDRLETIKSGSDSDLFAWLREQGYFHAPTNRARQGFAYPYGEEVRSPDELRGEFQRAKNSDHLGLIGGYVVHYSQALDRLHNINETSRRRSLLEAPTSPVHRLEDSPELMHEYGAIAKLIFNQELTLDHLDPTVKIRVGRPDVPAPPVDSVTMDYRRAMAELPLLSEQGDGMRSLLGLMLPIVAGSHPIVFIDEPEAFLHPPQAHELGRLLARISHNKGVQVVLATHDRSLVSGLLADSTVPVSIVRLDRERNSTRSFQLESDEVGELTKDSILRYSNALEGLFHQLVVIAEGNDDCRFYESALEALSADPDYNSYPPSEVLFVPSSGKQAMAKIATSIRAAGVRVVATPDLDVLDNEHTLKKLVEAMGGEWPTFEKTYRKATHTFRQERSPANCADILGAVEGVLKPLGREPYTSERRREVQVQMRLSESPWKALKEYGMRAFRGESRKEAEALLHKLDQIGIRIVREGDLEGFAPAVGVSKGPTWLAAALDARAHHSTEAREHLRRVVSGLSFPSGRTTATDSAITRSNHSGIASEGN
ncbi:ATP-dependent nuclease [Micromonospora palythoicola]|uniref:ATP-dependent nuclease n=1 Tax=Micromonospora palythoicola TaxID=3120507 RepID=UPI002FCE5AD8